MGIQNQDAYLSLEGLPNCPCRRHQFDPQSRKMPAEGDGNPLQYSCLEKSQGQRSLVGFNPRDHKKLGHE